MRRTIPIIPLLLCYTILICSCESKREQEAIKICQESKIQLDPTFVGQFGDADDVLSRFVIKAGFSLLGLDYDESTWLDFSNVVAEQHSNEKCRGNGRKECLSGGLCERRGLGTVLGSEHQRKDRRVHKH